MKMIYTLCKHIPLHNSDRLPGVSMPGLNESSLQLGWPVSQNLSTFPQQLQRVRRVLIQIQIVAWFVSGVTRVRESRSADGLSQGTVETASAAAHGAC